MTTKEEITEDQFEAYEEFRTEGTTNMMNLSKVSDGTGLDRDTLLAIMQNYNYLSRKYPPMERE